MIKHKVVTVVFDTGKWARVLIDACDTLSVEFMAEVCDVSPASLGKWKLEIYQPEFRYPNMTNFLSVCNVLDLNPADFFTTLD